MTQRGKQATTRWTKWIGRRSQFIDPSIISWLCLWVGTCLGKVLLIHHLLILLLLRYFYFYFYYYEYLLLSTQTQFFLLIGMIDLTGFYSLSPSKLVFNMQMVLMPNSLSFSTETTIRSDLFKVGQCTLSTWMNTHIRIQTWTHPLPFLLRRKKGSFLLLLLGNNGENRSAPKSISNRKANLVHKGINRRCRRWWEGIYSCLIFGTAKYEHVRTLLAFERKRDRGEIERKQGFPWGK